MNLLRPFLSLILVVVLLCIGGGFAFNVIEGGANLSDDNRFGLVGFVATRPVWLGLAALAFCSAWMVGGGAGLAASLRWLFGFERQTDCLLVQRTLASAARTLVLAGLFESLLAAACMFLVFMPPFDPANLNPVVKVGHKFWTILPGVFSIGVGRILFASTADWAAVRGGRPTLKTFSGNDDLMLLLYLIPPVLCMYSFTISYF